MNRCFGRLPADPVALAAAPRHTFGAVRPLPVLDRSLTDFVPGLYGNQEYPDCTFVALTNYARGVAFLNGYDLALDPAKPLAAYGAFLGNPVDLADTDGANVVDVLTWQATNGFDVGQQTPLVGNWGTTDQTSMTAIAQALCRLGPVYLGVTLLDRDVAAPVGAIWDVQAGRDDGAVAGGHAVIAWAYSGLSDTDIVQIGTWGYWQPVTWAWLRARLDEAHCLVYRQLERADGSFYDGLTADGLVADL